MTTAGMRSGRVTLVTILVAATVLCGEATRANDIPSIAPQDVHSLAAPKQCVPKSNPDPNCPTILVSNYGWPAFSDSQDQFNYGRLFLAIVSYRAGPGTAVVDFGPPPSSEPTPDAAKSACGSLTQPKAIIFWALYQERTQHEFILFRTYATDATLMVVLYPCDNGNAGMPVRLAKPLEDSVPSTSFPLTGIGGAATLLSGANSTSKTLAAAVAAYTSLGGSSFELGVDKLRDYYAATILVMTDVTKGEIGAQISLAAGPGGK